jgi:uncharacterized circularly permuted ATP-grasp superfamily protein/uncharacterized alpha-E superfamily protein
MLANYRTATDAYDEMLDPFGQPRPHWRALLDSLAAEAPGSMRHRLEAVQRQVRENGVTYNVYGDAKGMQRPWDLNLLPLILPQEEWTYIEGAIIQRATLLNKLLGDVYGEQSMMREGFLPPALIHGHDGFLRPCHGLRQIAGTSLHFYAADLARAPNGQWWVVNDRTQAPSGAGYALENRSIIGRTFPSLLRDLKVKPLAGFFRTMRDSLAHWGRECAANGHGALLREGEGPLIVLLTPGTFNETYYEQAYLARYLGLPLIEGSDLTVRNGMVWLKTLSGLQRVHVIMRRVDDDFCDPLELRTDSALGVAGLTEAARRGSVLIANSLGSSLLESGALMGFLPGLCERMLGETLKMPSVATWWCGEPAALNEVVERLDDLVVKSSFPQLRHFPVFGQDLQGDERAAMVNRLRANPSHYVAHELVRLSQGPVWHPGLPGVPSMQPVQGVPDVGEISPHAIGLRVFACATPDGYVVMPGGLTRVATGPDARVITMQHGGGSKDTWVQAKAEPTGHRLGPRRVTARDLVRDDTHLSSRMAENMFWLGRHTERCDDIARLLRVSLNILFDVRAGYPGAEWPTVEALCEWFELTGAGAISGREAGAPVDDAQIEEALLLAVVSPTVPGLARQQQMLYDTASQVRERLSVDNWRALNSLVDRPATAELPSQADAMTFLDQSATTMMTLAGFGLDGMTRDLGWRFLSIGRRLERLQFQTLVLQRALGMAGEANLDWALELSDSIVTYRSRYRAQPEWLPVLDLLLLDDGNPRSVLYQLDGLLKSLQRLASAYGPCGEDQLRPFREELLGLSIEDEFFGGNEKLIDLLARTQQASEALAEHISLQFFSYAGHFQHRIERR